MVVRPEVSRFLCRPIQRTLRGAQRWVGRLFLAPLVAIDWGVMLVEGK